MIHSRKQIMITPTAAPTMIIRFELLELLEEDDGSVMPGLSATPVNYTYLAS